MIELLRPPDDPVNYEAHKHTVHGKELDFVEVSHVVRRDWAIRTMMVQAVQYSYESVLTITKELGEADVKLLHGIELNRPFVMPQPVVCGLAGAGSHNEAMRVFPFDAYDALAEHFESAGWENWFIAPYFSAGDDAGDSFQLGVFVADTFNETVVE
jgi:hypothetical protein